MYLKPVATHNHRQPFVTFITGPEILDLQPFLESSVNLMCIHKAY